MIYVLFVVLAVAGRAIVKLWGDSRKHRRKLKEWVDEPVEIVGVSMMLLGFTVAVFGVWYLHLQGGGAPEGILADLVSDFYANLSVDFISVGIAVLLINRLYEQRSRLEEKQRIIEQLRSPSAEFAKEALRIVKEKGWSRDGSLKGVILERANLTDVFLADANLAGANLAGANLTDAFLSEANLTDADLSYATLTDAHLFAAQLAGANLRGADLRNANLAGADLSYARLAGANLTGATLTDATLFAANLSYANLRDANLGGADLWNAFYSADTTWPEGFDPVASGTMLTEERRPVVPPCPVVPPS